LADELKILIHIGSHRNILSVVGAVTQDLNNGQMFGHLIATRVFSNNVIYFDVELAKLYLYLLMYISDHLLQGHKPFVLSYTVSS